MGDDNHANMSSLQDGGSNTQFSLMGQSFGMGSVTPDEKLALFDNFNVWNFNIDENTDMKVRSALYDILCSNDLELIQKLFNKWHCEEFNGPIIFQKVLSILPEVYEEIKLKNVFLKKELEFFVENELISFNFLVENSVHDQQKEQNITKPKKTNKSFDDVINRVKITIELAKELTDKYLDNEKPVDQEFFLIARFMCQNIHTLKRQLRSTYNKIPWEEMEFCLANFIFMHTKCLEFNFAYKLVLKKENILKYVGCFAMILSEVTLSEDDINSKFPKQDYRELSAHDSAMQSVITGCANFQGLYDDFEQIKNIYSLKRIESYVKLSLSIDLDENEELGKLVIERTLQVIGESLKNTLESPNVSDDIHKQMLIAAPRNVRENVTLLRDSLSHVHTLRKRIELEDCESLEVFSDVQNDLGKLDTELGIILYKTKVNLITMFLKSVVDSKNEVELKELLDGLDDAELGELDIENVSVRELEDIRTWCNQLKGLMKAKTEGEENSLVEIEKILHLQETRLKDVKFIYATELSNLTDFSYMFSIKKSLEEIQNRARSYLNRMESKIPPQMLEKVVGLLSELAKSCELSGQYKFDELRAMDTLISKIRYSVLIGAVRIRGIDRFKESLEKKEGDPLIRAKGEIDRIICDIVRNITSNEDRASIQQEVVNQRRSYEAKLESDSCKNIVKNTRSSYQTLLNSVKNAMDQDLLDISKFFREFFKSFKNKNLRNKANAAIDDMLQENKEEREKHFENRLGMLVRLLPTNGVNDFETVEKYFQDRTLQAAVEMLVLDLMEALNEKSLLADNRLFFDGYSPILTGKSLRNYLAHGDALIDILPFDPALAIVSNALKLIRDKSHLVGHEKKNSFTIGRQIDCKLDNLKARYAHNLSVVMNQNDMFSAAMDGNVDKIHDCINKGADTKARDGQGCTCLHFAVKGNSFESVKFFLGKNLTDIKDNYGQTLLHTAAISKSSKVIRLLTEERGLNINDVDVRNNTALHYCAHNGCLDIVEALLDQGANVHVVNDDKVTPLHMSASCGNKAIVKALLDRNADALALAKKGLAPIHAAAMHGHKDVVDLILAGTTNVDITSKNNNTPLHYAACNGHKEVVEFLLDNKANVNALNRDHLTPIHLASDSGCIDAVLLLLKKGAKVNVFTKEFKWFPLHYAASSGHADVITLLLKNKAGVDSRTEDSFTPLHLAARKGHYRTVKALLDGNAKVDAKGLDDWTALHLGAMNGGTEVVKALVAMRVNVNAQSKENRTPLHLATLMGHGDVVEALIEAGGNMYARDNYGMTPLHYLAAYNHAVILNSTLDRIPKAEVDVKDDTGQAPLHLAAGQGYTRVVEVLLKHKADCNVRTKGEWTPLHFSAGNGHKGVVEVLLLNDANIDAITEHVMTPLHLAAMHNKYIVQVLLKQGANVDALNYQLRTPLHCAAFNGNKEIVEILLAANANVNLPDDEQLMPLHIAIEKGFKDVVQMLVNKGADLEVCCISNMTALQLAAFLGQADIIGSLLDRHRASDVNARNDSQMTALHWAAQADNAAATEALLARRADPNIVDKHLNTPLHIAISCCHVEVAMVLLNGGASLDARNHVGWTPLHYATVKKCTDVVYALLNNVCVQDNVDARDKNGSTPLHYAAKSGQHNVVCALLDKAADVNARNKSDKSALDMAASNGHADVVRALLERGADLLAQNDNGTVLHQAVESDNEDVIHVILDKFKERVGNDSLAMCQYVNATDSNKRTSLMCAVIEDSVSVVKLLLECGVNIDVKDNFDLTALYMATELGRSELVRLLLDKGASADIKCHIGKTPYELAKEKGFSEIAMILEPPSNGISLTCSILKSYWQFYTHLILSCKIGK